MILSKFVFIKWSPSNKKHYISKGYVFTKYGDEFEVKVEDLPNGSIVGVEVTCDNIDCKNLILKEIRWCDYKKSVRDDEKYYCQRCATMLYGKKKANETKINNNKDKRVGESIISRSGCKMTIIDYINYKNTIVRFDNGHIKNCTYGSFKSGDVRNPTNLGLGNSYMGTGEYNCVNYESAYYTWRNMIQRCYDKNKQEDRPTYIGCTVCDEWLNFQNFAMWYKENFYKIDGQKIHLDKDILIKGNKLYSPNMCCFVPSDINVLFVKHQNDRGKFPIGVFYNLTEDIKLHAVTVLELRKN